MQGFVEWIIAIVIGMSVNAALDIWMEKRNTKKRLKWKR